MDEKTISRLTRIFSVIAVTTMLGACLSTDSQGFVDVPGDNDPPSGDNPPPTSNTPPTIDGVPPTGVQMGEEYSFTPTASDPDGDTLTFSIVNKPNWADFDSATGALAGTPTLGEVGYFGDIEISVSDGQATDSLLPFGVMVSSDEPPPPPPPPTQAYIGFGSKTEGANSCRDVVETYRVTSLSGGSGAGTLRDAVSEDCRYIIFDVAGEIDLGDLQISNSYLTIDGATAPSPGITLTNVGRLVLEARGGQAVHDVIVNNIRAIGRGGSAETNDLWELDGSSGAPVYNVVLDHLTMARSADGNVDIYGDVYDITLSNSLIMDSIQGQHYSQSSGLRERITVFGNVFAGVNERQPRVRYNTRQLDFVGNVVYGWGWFEGGASGLNIDVGSGAPSANVENNVYHYVSGLDGSPDDALRIDSMGGDWFFTNNVWPSGESQGDGSSTTSRIAMTDESVDYSAPRQTTDIVSAGAHYKTAAESALLTEIANTVGGDTGGDDGDGGGDTGGDGGGDTGGDGGGDTPGPSSYRGIPEPSDVLGFDVWASYPADQVLTGPQGRGNLSCNGTAADPCVIDASQATFTELYLSGSYVILQGGFVQAPSGNGYWMSTDGCSNCVVRDVEVAGPGTDSGHSSAVGMGDRTVWIRGSVHGFGDNRVNAREQDFHGFKVQARDVWILEAEIYDVSGDSVQVGDASRGDGQRVYLGGGYYHHNRENAVDIKDSRDVVVSGVLMEGFRPTSSSPGEALIVHDDAYDARIYDNVVRDSTMGMVSSGMAGHIIDGNDITALEVGIQLRSTQNITVTNNTIDAPIRIEVQGGVTGTIQD